jgi:hypothetical protein
MVRCVGGYANGRYIMRTDLMFRQTSASRNTLTADDNEALLLLNKVRG